MTSPEGDRRHRTGPDPDRVAATVLEEIAGLLADLHAGDGRSVRLNADLTRDLGLDSLSIVELHDRVERAFRIELPEEVLANALTPADWVAAVLRAGSGGRASVAEQIVAPASRSPSEPWPAGVSTLNEAFSWHVTTHPDVLTIRVLGPDGGVVKDEIDYGALDRDARLVAENLVEEKLTPGERVAIMLPTGRSYFAVFLGTLLAGGVPVPLYPPANLSQLEEHLRRQSRVLENAEAAMLVTVPEARLAARLLRSQVPSLERIRTPEALAARAKWREPLPVPRAEDLALIQYTSGSTGDPKGVALTHRAAPRQHRRDGRTPLK